VHNSDLVFLLNRTLQSIDPACCSLRAEFAFEDNPINQLHGSMDPEQAKKELDFFFPMEQTVAVIKPDAMGTKG
jgi:nucleoside diphosphate kinase